VSAGGTQRSAMRARDAAASSPLTLFPSTVRLRHSKRCERKIVSVKGILFVNGG
jgi:hypothetical protein